MPIRPNRTGNFNSFQPITTSSEREGYINIGTAGNAESLTSWTDPDYREIDATLAGVSMDGNSRAITHISGTDTVAAYSTCLWGTSLPAPLNPQPYILQIFVNGVLAGDVSTNEDNPDRPVIFAWISAIPDTVTYSPRSTQDNDIGISNKFLTFDNGAGKSIDIARHVIIRPLRSEHQRIAGGIGVVASGTGSVSVNLYASVELRRWTEDIQIWEPGVRA